MLKGQTELPNIKKHVNELIKLEILEHTLSMRTSRYTASAGTGGSTIDPNKLMIIDCLNWCGSISLSPVGSIGW